MLDHSSLKTVGKLISKNEHINYNVHRKNKKEKEKETEEIRNAQAMEWHTFKA